ncbi:MAG: universal stress protein [Verrucomicrobiota bacterium]
MATQTLPAETKSAVLRIRKILAPLDFSPPSNKAFKYALRLAKEFGAELTLIHILDAAPSAFADVAASPACAEEELSRAEHNLRALTRSARVAGVIKARSTFRSGLAAHEIVEAARELDVDLIVIATHGYTGWKHFCIGSTAERVVRAAPCPVLVVREKEHDFV